LEPSLLVESVQHEPIRFSSVSVIVGGGYGNSLPAPNYSLLNRRLLAIASGILISLLIWIPAVTPNAFLRYLVPAIPVACLMMAWVLVFGIGWRIEFAWIGAAVLTSTPWLSWPLYICA